MGSKEKEAFSSGTSSRIIVDPEVDGDCEGDPPVESDPGVVVLEAMGESDPGVVVLEVIGESDPGVVVLEAIGERDGDTLFDV